MSILVTSFFYLFQHLNILFQKHSIDKIYKILNVAISKLKHRSIMINAIFFTVPFRIIHLIGPLVELRHWAMAAKDRILHLIRTEVDSNKKFVGYHNTAFHFTLYKVCFYHVIIRWIQITLEIKICDYWVNLCFIKSWFGPILSKVSQSMILGDLCHWVSSRSERKRQSISALYTACKTAVGLLRCPIQAKQPSKPHKTADSCREGALSHGDHVSGGSVLCQCSRPRDSQSL